jgi:MFS family permease
MSFLATYQSFKSRDFFFLWLGMLTLMFGMNMQMLVRSYFVYELENSGMLLGLVNAGSAIPMLTLALVGGVIADRLNKKRIIQAGQVLAGIVSLVVAILILTETVTWIHLLIASIAQGAVFAFMMPARQALIPQMVGQKLVSNAVALNATAMSFTTLAAPTAAGLLYEFIGPGKVYLLITILNFSSVLFTILIKNEGYSVSLKKGSTSDSNRPSVLLEDMIQGIKYVRRNSFILILLAIALSTTILAQPFRFIMPIFIVDIYGLKAGSMGLLVSAMGLGALIGSIYIAALGNRMRGGVLLISSYLSGLSLLLVAAVPVYLLAALIMLPLGLGDAGRRSINMALIMEESGEEYRGRVMSIYMLNWGLMPLGVLPAGLMADWLGGQVSIAVLAVLLILFTVWITFKHPEIRRYQ